MLFFSEQSHLGAGQYHTHMIIERMPATLNTQAGMENLFRKELPAKIRCLSKWKGIDIQRISCEDKDLRKLASYLGKQSDLTTIAFDAFNSDLDQNYPITIIKRKHENNYNQTNISRSGDVIRITESREGVRRY